MTNWDLFADVGAITAWLDTSNPASPHEDSMRVLKLVEEAGEAAAAYIGMVGQNPRKGVTHTMDDLLNELADVALTALCAMQHFTQDTAVTRGVLASKVAAIMARSDIRAPSAAEPVSPLSILGLDPEFTVGGRRA
jgi:NTP pyrophosphatase (non-canonical NTP hydrolase)